jgi:uncharacterized protein YdhG (YjbR/CyaY superfamily)
MAETKAAKRPARQSGSGGLSADERAAARERVREVRRGKVTPEKSTREVLDKIAEMPEADRRLAERFHALVMETAPDLVPRTWYGMPAYAKDDRVICFFKSAIKFKARYATVGFSDRANLDDGAMWPTDFALSELTPEVEKRLVELVTRAVS